MSRIWLALVGVAAALSLAVPAATADTTTGPPTTGTQLIVYSGTTTFPANTPFYVRHGFATGVQEPTSNWGEIMRDSAAKDVMSGLTHFDLYVDGRKMPSVTDLNFGDNGNVSKTGLTNFRKGLPAGVHTFVGTWYSDGVLVLTRTAVVTFT